MLSKTELGAPVTTGSTKHETISAFRNQSIKLQLTPMTIDIRVTKSFYTEFSVIIYTKNYILFKKINDFNIFPQKGRQI